MKLSKLVFLSVAGIMFAVASQALAAGDISKGKKLAKKCKSCHTMNEGGKNRLGPNLFDILGKPAGGVEGYKYSKAMIAFGDGKTWTAESLDAYVTKPKDLVPGTKMKYPGLKKEADRANLIAYLASVK